jgi:hypothetical protein
MAIGPNLIRCDAPTRQDFDMLPIAAIRGNSAQLTVSSGRPTKNAGPEEDGRPRLSAIASTVGRLWRMKDELVVTNSRWKQTGFRQMLPK